MTNRYIHGFTLIELMITVAIFAIIVSIAYPSYQGQVRKSRRADAEGALMGLANAMERVFTENNTYRPGGSAPALGSGGIYPDQAPIDGTTKYYNLTIQAASGSAYTLRATPISGGAQDEDGYLELQSTGVRGWDKNNDGDTTDAGENSWEH